MGKPTGFLEYYPLQASYQQVSERIKHYKEFTIPLSAKEMAFQGARCMDCGIPFCHSSAGCPVANLIPEWNDLIYHDRWQEAYERLELTNNLPEITGRVCPAPCETACTLAINDSPVTIKQIELAIIEKAFAEGWVIPRPAAKTNGKKVAIIGSGPAGLAAAQQLCRSGHEVTVFEKSPKIGGTLRYGIPDFKLEKWVIDRRLEQMKKEGITFENDINIGEDISARYLKKSFDVILLAVGAGQPRDLAIPGRELNGIHFAMDYLTKSNMFVEGAIKQKQLINAKDKTVLVLGGGDTGSDCVGTAVRQGAKQVYQFEILPKPREWHEMWNPEWPNWPNILHTTTSHEEGCYRDWSIITKSFEGNAGKVKKVHFTRAEWENTNPGSTPVMKEITDSEASLDADLVLLALGFVHTEHSRLHESLGIEYDPRGNIALGENYQTSVEGVFAAGDATIGASLVVHAIFHGRQAARVIAEYLRG
jgi:glutamate synthase (NADPH/NADH) small chain